MAFFENPQRFCIFVKTILIVMLKDGKQERTVVHLELNGSHFYYGNLKALCDNWGKNDIGISYNYLKNYGISETKPYVGKKCIIRRGTIVTSPQQKEKTSSFSRIHSSRIFCTAPINKRQFVYENAI
jgi:hypothetical protein